MSEHSPTPATSAGDTQIAEDRGASTRTKVAQTPSILGQPLRPGWVVNPAAWARQHVGLLLLFLEVAGVLVWAIFVTRPYLNLDPMIVPAGREYLSAIQTHIVWENVKACGACAFWYGSVGGGLPAFADPVASTLHPLVIVTTWIWGVVNGSKVALIVMFAAAGLGQWWLGSLLGLRWPSRVWAAGMAIAAGYLAGRMELGAFSLVLSTATAVLAFPAMVAFARSRSMKSAVALAAVLAMVAVGGTGYMQVGLAFLLPMAALLVPWERRQLVAFTKRAALAIGLAVILAAPLIVPFFRFMPQIAKDYDITFAGAQDFAHVPLNLVIRDMGFYRTEALGKFPWPSHYVNFVGWVPILLAAWGLRGARTRDERRAIAFFASTAFLALWLASATPLAWLAKTIKVESLVQFIAGIRYTPFLAGLAVPALLGLASIGLDQLLDGLTQRVNLSLEGTGTASAGLSLDIRWVLAVPLAISLSQARNLTREWIRVIEIGPSVSRVVEALRTPDLAWVDVPLGEHFFVEPAVEQGLKLSGDFFRTWHWEGRPRPPVLLGANRNGPPPGMTEQMVVDGVHIHRAVDEPAYAAVEHPDGSKTACRAQGTGGNIDVTCHTSQEGHLVVQENSWSGWRVLIDGQPAELRQSNWLSVEAPKGKHRYAFRYRPWDVLAGIALFLAGVIVSGWLAWREPGGRSRPEGSTEEAGESAVGAGVSKPHAGGE